MRVHVHACLDVIKCMRAYVSLCTRAGRCEDVTWDSADSNVLAIHDGSSLRTYVYMSASLSGPLLQLVRHPAGLQPQA